ncbi:MAG TPA: ATP-dependent 6-phosphofructokinase [Thermoanaerobaculia bacterium]|nr:ATP-dependent 6-phosphofructokinase [Thermoanaerobaculia bacterium]
MIDQAAETILETGRSGMPPRPAFDVRRLGPARLPSPLSGRRERFIGDGERVLATTDAVRIADYLEGEGALPCFERAGPRRELFFDPRTLGAGIVTCGGLCPGLNNVIRSIVLNLYYAYGVRRILGYRRGYLGLSRRRPEEPLELGPAQVESIHERGGTILGTSRGPQDVGEMIDTLQRDGVQILFTLGGDGTLRGAAALAREIERRGLAISVIGVPKTIDNDIAWVDRSFGFTTAIEEGNRAIHAAHAEAQAAWNGIGMVKLMGRHSGFIAAHATLSNNDVNFCLVPEVPFSLHGHGGFLEALEQRLQERRHAVIVVAEGAGQELLRREGQVERDASGNVRLLDVGVYLRDRITEHFSSQGMDVTIKYIDPSYIIRSQPANSSDAELCLFMGEHAVHAGLAGRTEMVVGYRNQQFIHLPIPLAVARRKSLDRRGKIWEGVLGTTGQPVSMLGDSAI